MKIVGISDTHNRHSMIKIPECDMLIHAGDATGMGYESEVRAFAKWFNKQKAPNKIWVPGNHELNFEKNLPASKQWFYEECSSGILLLDEEIVIDGVKIFGSPQTPYFCDWGFNKARNKEEAEKYNIRLIKEYWDAIPLDTKVLVTHGMPYGILDWVPPNAYHASGFNAGCQDLLDAVKRIKPDIVMGGHLHFNGGQQVHQDGTSFYNLAVCDERYYPSNPITIIEYT